MQLHRTDSEDGTTTAAPAGDDACETHHEAAACDEVATSISKDDAFHLLQNARRRAVLRYLIEHEGTARFRMRDIAEAVAAWEHDTTVQQLCSDERQRVYIALYQSHLPKLDEQGIIEYNQSRGVVEPEPLLGAVEPFLAEGLHAEDELVMLGAGIETDNASNGRFGTVVASLFNNR